ncbi:MAG: GHMP kinase [Thermacetogeniaceae bacterium]
MILQGTALVPGTCGELVQGTMSGKNFLITCPVNWYSRVTVKISGHRILFPADRIKTAQAVRKALDREDCPGRGAVIDVASSLPIGKGMGSSTADLSAACFAVAAALGRRLSPEAVAEIALSIEPSDATFSRGIVLFDHVEGQIHEQLGEPIPIGLLALDFGGAVDTVEFHQRQDLAELNAANETAVSRALELVRDGLRRQDPARLGEGATMSALANQRVLPKPRLEAIIDYAMAQGAYGVNVAHSGTVAGVLLPLGREAEERLIRDFCRRFPEIEKFYSLRLTGGGPRYLGEVRAGREVYCGKAPARGRHCLGCSQVRH